MNVHKHGEMSGHKIQQALYTLLLRHGSISKSNHISKIFKSTRQIASLQLQTKGKTFPFCFASLSAEMEEICMKKFIFREIFISLAFQSQPKSKRGGEKEKKGKARRIYTRKCEK